MNFFENTLESNNSVKYNIMQHYKSRATSNHLAMLCCNLHFHFALCKCANMKKLKALFLTDTRT